MKDKTVIKERSVVKYTDTGTGVIESGKISGNLSDIMAFSDVIIRQQMDHVYTAASNAIPADGVDSKTAAMAAAIDVVKNAFNDFVEEHGAEEFAKAVALQNKMHDLMAEMEAEQ